MKIGALTDKPEPVTGFDLTFYNIKSCTGKINEPVDGVINIINCFEDNRTARKHPEWVSVCSKGKAIRTNKQNHFLWDHICPTVEDYKIFLFDLIKNALKSDCSGIHLEGIGFPESEYCLCERCIEGQKETNLEFDEWKSKVVTDFIKEASEIVKQNGKTFSITLMPDPFFGKKRYGQDIGSLSKSVDFFIVPLYDLVYSTTYWLKTLAYGFNQQLEKPLFIELYAAKRGPSLSNLLSAIAAVSEECDAIILATHSSSRSKEIREELVKTPDFSKFLKRHRCDSMLNIIKTWKTTINT